MSSAYERLISLFSDIGLRTDEGSRSEAEAFALSEGIRLVADEIEGIKKRLFYGLYGEEGSPALYAQLLGIDGVHTDETALRTGIRNRLSADYGGFAISERLEGEEALFGGDFTVDGEALTLENINNNGVYYVGAFAEGCVPYHKMLYLEYGGMTFSQWDSLGFSFRQFSRLRLPFSCIDTLDISLFNS